jgi:hypothetical protein
MRGTARRFSRKVVEALDEAQIIGVRAGHEHKYTGVWVVVVEGRVFVRSWNDTPTGWYRAFLAEPLGSITFGDAERRVRSRPTRSVRLRDAVSRAYREKYNTKGSQKWVRGFARPTRTAHTMEFVPR